MAQGKSKARGVIVIPMNKTTYIILAVGLLIGCTIGQIGSSEVIVIANSDNAVREIYEQARLE